MLATDYISSQILNEWKAQFRQEDQWAIIRLLKYLRFYSIDEMTSLLKNLHQTLFNIYGNTLNNAIYVPCGYVASSGAAVSYLYRRANQISEKQFIAIADIAESVKNGKVIVFLDDFIGTGHSAIYVWNKHILPVTEIFDCEWVFACAVGYENAKNQIEQVTSFKVYSGESIPSSEQPFYEGSAVFPDPTEREQAKKIIHSYSEKLVLRSPFGYGDVQGLVSFFFNTPDNTLPIFWSTSAGWKPLLPFGKTSEDYTNAVRQGRGFAPQAVAVVDSSKTAINELHSFDNLDMAPDTAISILQEFQSLEALITLAPIINQLGISSESVKTLIGNIHRLRHAVHEQKSVQTAILVIPSSELQEIGHQVFVSPTTPIPPDDVETIQALAELVNGFDGTVVLRADGTVIGNILYGDETDVAQMVPSRFRAAAGTSRLFDALAIVFAGNGRVCMIFRGTRILSYRQTTWHIISKTLQQNLDRLERRFRLKDGLLSYVHQAALDMSDRGFGAIFMIGDEKEITDLSDTQITQWKWEQLRINNESIEQITVLAKQDGATLIARDGTLIRNGVILRPPAEAEAEINPTAGARHSSAAKISSVSSSVAVVVSEDGKITIFSDGKSVIHDIA